MANTRMAGDKINEPTQESADAKQAISNAERNRQIREEIGNDPERLAQRISGVDRSAFNFDGYTDKEINMAMQGEKFDENDYARLTGRGSKPKAEVKPEPEKPEVVTPEPTPEVKPETPSYTPPEKPDFQGIGGGFPVGGQNINQDNDITSNVTGDNNQVTNTQDNSINKYGAYGSADRAKMLRDRYVADVSRFAGVS